MFPCVNTPQSRISGPCKALNLGLHPSRRSKQPGNTRMSFTERTSLYFCVCCVLERSPAETSLTCWHLVTILCPPIHLHIQKSNCQHRGQVSRLWEHRGQEYGSFVPARIFNIPFRLNLSCPQGLGTKSVTRRYVNVWKLI